jgi:hypothetical protein
MCAFFSASKSSDKACKAASFASSSRSAEASLSRQNQQVLDLEQYLLRANSGQGLGFVLGGIVVNPRMLKKVGAAVYLVLLPVGTYMVSMGGADGVSTVAV